MGYTTEFEGRINIEPPLNPHEIDYLTRFSESRRMDRTNGPYYIGGGSMGQAHEADIIDYNRPHSSQPGLWCNWVPTPDGTALVWDGMEKFYDSVEWMIYLINYFLRPDAITSPTGHMEIVPAGSRPLPEEFRHFTYDHILSGVIHAQGEEDDDEWLLHVMDNRVVRTDVVEEGPIILRVNAEREGPAELTAGDDD